MITSEKVSSLKNSFNLLIFTSYLSPLFLTSQNNSSITDDDNSHDGRVSVRLGEFLFHIYHYFASCLHNAIQNK